MYVWESIYSVMRESFINVRIYSSDMVRQKHARAFQVVKIAVATMILGFPQEAAAKSIQPCQKWSGAREIAEEPAAARSAAFSLRAGGGYKASVVATARPAC